MIKKLFTILLLTTLLTPNAFGSSLPDFPFIGVQGIAEIDVKPDTAEVSFSLIDFTQTSENALKKIKLKSNEVLELAEKYDIPLDKIISSGIENNIKRHSNRDTGYSQTEILGYEIRQSFNVTIDDLSTYTTFIDELILVSNIGQINANFDTKNRKEITRDLVKKAGEDAKQKANDLADAMNVSLKSVYAINQDTSYEHFFAKFGLQEKIRSGGMAHMMLHSPTQSNDSLNMMIPKSITLSKTISVVYKIKP